jgi:2-polyprenyl-3-methyl-5-hydroxy-6-metoxy-1,4-benzoquinol methylase
MSNEIKPGGNESQNSAVERYSAIFRRVMNSPTYAQFSEAVYGRNLCQFNVVDEEQLQRLFSDLKLSSSHSVLDLGCGPGFVSEYISDTTGANVTGVDIAREIIELANVRTEQKRDRLKFVTADLNNLSRDLGVFDCVLSFDTLYFTDNLLATIQTVKSLLKSTGTLAAFYSFNRKEDAPRTDLDSGKNLLAVALNSAGFNFQTTDFLANEKKIWESSLLEMEKLKQAFEAEGLQKTYEGCTKEARAVLKLIAEGRRGRALYLASHFP